MPDMEKVIKELESLRDICNAKSNMAIGNGKVAWAGYANAADDELNLLKEQDSLLGIQQTADSITFISTGTAKQGEERGIVLGQARMHDWLEKELLYRGLLTDAIRAVFHDARRLVK